LVDVLDFSMIIQMAYKVVQISRPAKMTICDDNG
jgi:hypothetical protein